jgi:apolipoprotein N-acyltransferase
LWPENAVDVDPFQNQDVNDELNSFSKPIVLGAIVNKGGQNFNSSILWSNKRQIIYNKQHLTPFGEYIPLRSLATKISPLANQVSDFTPGDSQVIFKINSAKIVPVICYELIDDSLLESAANSANLIVVQTNSATFGKSAESAQQLSITRIRAIEHSRNILSVSTTGYSAIIDHSGKIIKSTKMGVADHLYAEVGLIDQLSMRDRLGDWALIITLIWLLLVARRSYVYRR